LLYLQPNHADAIKRLGLRNYQGWLLTPEEIKKVKVKEKQFEQTAKVWTPRLKKLLRAMKRGEASERETAIRELQSIQDPLAIPAIEEVFSSEGPDIILYVVGILAGMPGQQATEFLLRQAVQSEHPEVRERATYLLTYRPYEDYVPSLIAGLATPIEMSSHMSMEPGGPIYQSYHGYVLNGVMTPLGGNKFSYSGRLVPQFYHRIRLNGNYTSDDVATWKPEGRRISGTRITGYRPDRYRLQYRLSRESPDPDVPYEFTGDIEGSSNSILNSSDSLKQKIQEHNAVTLSRNLRIHEALKNATGVDATPEWLRAANENEVEVNPQHWWAWWRKQLDLNNYFAQGIEVWTQTGLLPIEQILIGDRVLTRDSESGELTFNLVIGFDVQPQDVMLRIEIDSRTIVATPEQPFFVTGDGWRKANELHEGMQLDGLVGSRTIAKVGPGVAVNTYNLMVENSSNYFVDRNGILVSDATPINSKR
jgi:hypothetical protein